MRVRISDEATKDRLFGDQGPSAGDTGSVYEIRLFDETYWAYCFFDDWPGIWMLDLNWLMYEREGFMSTQ